MNETCFASFVWAALTTNFSAAFTGLSHLICYAMFTPPLSTGVQAIPSHEKSISICKYLIVLGFCVQYYRIHTLKRTFLKLFSGSTKRATIEL